MTPSEPAMIAFTHGGMKECTDCGMVISHLPDCPNNAPPPPRRIQRKRTKGWKMPENTVYVGRPTIWGNPWKVGDEGFESMTREYAAMLFQMHRLPMIGKRDIEQLRGKNLACWCPLDQPCHADALLEIANKETR